MRFTANTAQQQQEMLGVCGVKTVDDFFDVIPQRFTPRSFNVAEERSEQEVLSYMHELAGKNATPLYFAGGGFYDHYIPAAVDEIAGRSEFYTAYTPYQPEISQGTLQAIYEYQSHICRFTGMYAANASLYDGGTAIIEAAKMAQRTTGREKVVIDETLNPVYRRMLESYAPFSGLKVVTVAVEGFVCDQGALINEIDDTTACVIVQNPTFFGGVDDFTGVTEHARNVGALSVISSYPIALACIKTPGEMGFDIAVGEGQSLGIPLSFGGPYLGYMATTKKLTRKMPGRIAGRTVDLEGNEGYVLTLQPREQHIRREKATSNICTNQALCALRATVYCSLLGTHGITETAQLCMDKAAYAKQRFDAVTKVKVEPIPTSFNEFVVRLPGSATEIVSALLEKGVLCGIPLGKFDERYSNHLLVAVTEKRTRQQIDACINEVERSLCQ